MFPQVDDTESKDTEDHTDFRENSRFLDHMKVDQEGGKTEFSLTKTLKQQREYLPVYAVRQKLLHIIRDSVPDPNPDPRVFWPPDPLVRGVDPGPDPEPDPDPWWILLSSCKTNK
jgi:hypothetical protein